VNLVSPGGSVIGLHSRTEGSADNIIKTYNLSNTTSLVALKGEPTQGNWKLKVSDVAGLDVGKLNRWSIKITQE